MKPVFDLLPQRRVLEALLDDLVDLRLGPAEDVRTVRDIVVDRFRKRIGALEQHADLAAKVDDIGIGRQHVVAVEQYFSGSARARSQVVHPVEDPQEGRFAAA